jgi:hypothetical protein
VRAQRFWANQQDQEQQLEACIKQKEAVQMDAHTQPTPFVYSRPSFPGNGAPIGPPFLVTGRDIAHSHRTPSQRAALAAQLVLGEAKLTKPTITQVVEIVRVSGPYVRFAMRLKENTRERVGDGELPLAAAARANGLLAAWLDATPEEQAALGTAVGVNAIWNCAIAPSI